MRGQEHAFRYLDLRSLGTGADDITSLNAAVYPAYYADLIESQQGAVGRLIRAVASQIMTPRYRKIGMKELLYQLASKRSGTSLTPIKLSECGKPGKFKDILITARDLHRGETTFFSAFHIPHRSTAPPDNEVVVVRRRLGNDEVAGKIVDVVTGTYRDVMLKDAIEASASAPVYFSPRSQFSDGGIGANNNPAFMAAIEALRYSHRHDGDPALPLKPKYKPYSESGGSKSGTAVWSFGTSYAVPNPDEEADIPRVIGGSLALKKRTDTAIYWVETVIDNLMFGANQEQDYLCREMLGDQIKYLRFNLGLNRQSLTTLQVPGDKEEILAAIKLDAFEAEPFDLMDKVAKQFARFARDRDFGFDDGGYHLTGRGEVAIDTYATNVKQNFGLYE